MAISDSQRERVKRYQTQREQYLAFRARDLREAHGGTTVRMESKAKFLGHAIHPMLIVFPLGLLATSAIFDVIRLYTGNGKWSEVSYYMMVAGIIGGLIAAVPGIIDWGAIPGGTRAKTIGLWHGIGNVVMIGMFAASWALRQDNVEDPRIMALVLSFAGVSVALMTGWLGGELVDRLGVGVDSGAHVDSPNSLSRRSAAESSRIDAVDESESRHAHA